MRTFLDSVAVDPLYPLFLMLATTGMRRGEGLGLRWRDLDLDARRAAIRQTVLCVGHETRFSEPKTDRSKRSVPLPSETVAALRSQRATQAEQRLASESYQDLGLVFATPHGGPLDPESVSAMFDRRVRAVEVPRIRLHDLRHTFATLALQAGVHAKVVSEILGHASISITLDTYSHAIPSMQDDATSRVAALLFP